MMVQLLQLIHKENMADVGSSEQISFYKSGLTTTFPNQSFGYYIQKDGSTLESDKEGSNLINAIFQRINNGINIGEMPTTYYLMRWADPDCMTTTYRTWVVTGSPDPTGLQYAGVKCGGTAISGAIISAQWTE